MFLVFWESGCSHCVEALLDADAFYRERRGIGVRVIGVNSDSEDLLGVRGLIEAYGIEFPQLWDRSGVTAKEYEVPFETFTLYLVDGRGMVLSRIVDPGGDIAAVMALMLEGGEELFFEEPADKKMLERSAAVPAPTAGSGFTFGGYQRIRFLGIDANGSDPTGPYGEEVESRNNLLFRFELEMKRKLTKHVTIGGLLSISNESEEVHESGPEYLGSEWGSAYAEIEWNCFSLRLGYYPFHMTPLTLMRWDWDDNPRIGGDAGCGCGAAAGMLLVESLEELGPELVFEGGIAAYRGSNTEARIFYAIPKRAEEVAYREVRSTGADPARYSLEIYGFDGRLQKYDSRTGQFWKAGLHVIGTWENRRSVDFAKLGYASPYPWFGSLVISMSGEVPVARYVRLIGEGIVYNESRETFPEQLDMLNEGVKKSGGGNAGVLFEKSQRFTVRADYVHLGPDFNSPFSALSYEANKRGFRFSSQLPLPGDVSIVSLFYKRLWEIETGSPDAEKEKASVFGASVDVDLKSGLGGGIGWLDRGTWREGDLMGFDEVRRAIVLSARYRFDKLTYMQLQYQFINHDKTVSGGNLDSETAIYSAYFAAIF